MNHFKLSINLFCCLFYLFAGSIIRSAGASDNMETNKLINGARKYIE